MSLSEASLRVRHPIAQAKKFPDFAPFITALLNFRGSLIRHAERVFVISNEVDQGVGCFHQDLFPFG